MRAAVIDIGSNSIKLIIGEKDGDQIKILDSLKNVIPMGKNVFNKGRITQEITNQTVTLLEKYKQKISEYDVKNIKVIATTAVREATNNDMFTDTVFRKTGFKIEIFNVGDVVYYIDSFLSLKLKKSYPIFEKNLLIAELGAGSLDISVMEKGYAMLNIGIPIGTSRLRQFRNKMSASMEEGSEAIKEYIENEISTVKKALPKFKIDDLILIDESYSTSLQNILSLKKLENNFFPFKESDADELIKKISEINTDEIQRKYNLPQDIADTIDGYAIIVRNLFKLTTNNYIYILETSLPEALLANMIFEIEQSKENNKTSQLVSAATYLCHQYNSDLNHAKHVAFLSEKLFESLKSLMGLEQNHLLYLTLAAYLHDIGKFINNRSHHKHAEYIIRSSNFFRLTDEEVKVIACVARYHRRTPPSTSHYFYGSLSHDNQILVQKLCSILKIANALDGAHKQKVKNVEVKIDKKQEVKIIIKSKEKFVLEKANFLEKKELFEEITGNKISLILASEA